MERIESAGKETVWLFGRGASVACRLEWKEPPDWKPLPREKRIGLLKKTLREKMNDPTVDTGPYRQLLAVLNRRTTIRSQHLFVTTNWDTLLDRDVDKACPRDCPPWLKDSHVFHLNGTVEDPDDDPLRSSFLLESDRVDAREAKLESDKAFAHMYWPDCFVVVGMSFECETDGFLLTRLGNAPPVEGSSWFVVNPNESALRKVCANIQSKLPGARVTPAPWGFAEWLGRGLPELRDLGVLRNES